MKLVKRTGILFFALLVFFGSGGWVLTDHLCREADDSCNSQQEMSCCCVGDTKEIPRPSSESIVTNTVTDCCITTSSYFSMPLFRVETTPGQAIDHFITDLCLPVVVLTLHISEATFCLPTKPPPDIHEGEDFLSLTGQLLI